MKVYAVESYYGKDEEQKTIVNGIYVDDKIANAYKQRIRDYYKDILKRGIPIGRSNDFGNTSYIEELELRKMQKEYFEAEDYIDTAVKEYEINNLQIII
jgi:hypothetical protein